MSQLGLIFKSLRYFWRTNLAVLLGVAIGTAVIAGALIVGDSVRASLRQMTLDRLGEVDYALSGGRFFREQIATQLEQQPITATDSNGVTNSESAPANRLKAAPAILVTGTLQFEPTSNTANEPVETTDTNSDGTQQRSTALRIAGRVNLIGGDDRLWSLLKFNDADMPNEDELVLNERVAEQLGVNVGDDITLFVDIPQSIPQESLLGERDIDEKVVEFPLTVSQIVPAVTTAGRFSLLPNQQLPLNAYVNLERLQLELDLAEQIATPRNPIAKPARVNALLVDDPGYDPELGGPTAIQAIEATTQRFNESLESLFTLEDLFLKLRTVDERDYFAIESERMILEQSLSYQAMKTAEQMSLKTAPVLVYLVNEIRSRDNPDNYSTYSVAAGVEFSQTAPFGPFVDLNGEPVIELKPDEVAINSWLADDLQIEVGQDIEVDYHVVGSRGELPETTQRFRVAAILQMDGSPADDVALTPFVEGITDAETFADWEQPFPMKMQRITDRDDEYWERYRSTPKLFLSLESARELWQSRYGNTTSVRVAGKPDQSVTSLAESFQSQFLNDVSYFQLGLTMLPVKQQGLDAAQGTQDFTGLFIGFSFFVIAAATVLIGLLFQLGMETRLAQIGLLSALGFSRSKIRTVLISEGFVIGMLGMLVGLVLAVLYAQLMIYGLTTWWRGAIGTTFLQVAVVPASLLAGGVIALTVALPGMWLGIRRALSIPPRERMQGGSGTQLATQASSMTSGWKLSTGLVGLVCAVLMVGAVVLNLVPAVEAFGGFNWHIVMFFLSGFLSLIGSLLVYVAVLRGRFQGDIGSRGIMAAVQLGTRNMGRNRQRSSVTVVLVSLATFVVVAVAAGRQRPIDMEPVQNSGNGGFALVAESARPILYDLTTSSGQDQLGLTQRNDGQLSQLLNESTVMAFRVRPGEDASCLNLYQTRLPTVLGVPDAMIERGGFLFADTPGENPWERLRGETAAGRIPVMGDQNTLQYSLHKAIGNLIELPPEVENRQDLEIVGALSGSLFQGVLLVSEENFLKLFPEISGYGYFLIDTPESNIDPLTSQLESQLVTFGLDVELVGRRLQNFLAVQNTYLSTFQALGGFGLLLGTIGLGTVMLRNVLERRSELALMRAIGFQRSIIGMMVLAENLVLLLLGLSIGTGCAVLAMLPTVLSSAGDVPWSSGISLLGGVLATGILASLLAINAAVRTPVLSTLRSQ